MEIYTFDDWKWDVKKREVKNFFRSLPAKARDIWNKDKELILFLTPGIVYLVKRASKYNAGLKEDYHRNCQIYDQSLGMWHDLRRPMNTKQKTEFSTRRKAGESVLQILISMGLLKR